MGITSPLVELLQAQFVAATEGGFSPPDEDKMAKERAAATREQAVDEALLRFVGNAMEMRVTESRLAGKAGWHGDALSNDELIAKLKANLEAGDFLDVAIFAGMVLARQALGKE